MATKIKLLTTLATLLIAAAGVMTIQSCKKESSILFCHEQTGNEADTTDITHNILFYNNINNIVKDNYFAKVLRMKLFRKSKNCESGLGICEIYIFEQQVYKGKSDIFAPSREIYYEIGNDSQCDTLILLLASDVSNIESPELDLYVDEDIYGFDDNFTTQVTFPQGVYHYNNSLGEYGGYAVNYTITKTK
ncbi:MAG: hypothetical protein ACI35Y_03415 [Candidatus Limimorpha sp.]